MVTLGSVVGDLSCLCLLLLLSTLLCHCTFLSVDTKGQAAGSAEAASGAGSCCHGMPGAAWHLKVCRFCRRGPLDTSGVLCRYIYLCLCGNAAHQSTAVFMQELGIALLHEYACCQGICAMLGLHTFTIQPVSHRLADGARAARQYNPLNRFESGRDVHLTGHVTLLSSQDSVLHNGLDIQ